VRRSCRSNRRGRADAFNLCNHPLFAAPTAALALMLAIGEEKWEWFERAIRATVPVYASALAVMLFCLVVFGVLDAAVPSIYFQF
jgi:hypothetical protein